MGQGASAPRRKRKKKSKKSSASNQNDPALLKLEDRIAMVKQDLIRTKQEGEVNRRGQEDDIYKFEMELYKKKDLLQKRGNDAKNYIGFWGYAEIVNTVLHPADSLSVSGRSGEMTLGQHREAMKEAEMKKAEQGTVIKHTGNFNVYSFFEAFLLRRLHVAMILKHQRAKQSDVWNDVIMFLYDMMPGMRKRTQVANEKYKPLKPESNETMREMIKLQKKKIKLYERMIETLREEVAEEQMASSMGDGNLLEELEVPTKTVGDDAEELNTAKYYQKGGRHQDDDEMSFKSMTSRKSSRSSRSKRNKNRNSNSEQAPRWKKSSRSKMSKTINRDMNSSLRSETSRSSLSPSPSPKRASESQGDTSKITDEDIERFLFPNKPVQRQSGGAARVRTPSGVSSSRELPSELEFDDHDNRTTISTLNDDTASVESASMRTPAKLDVKAQKNDLDKLREEVSDVLRALS